MNNDQLPIWTFNIGAAAINYHVYGKDQAEGYRVACAWCKEKGKRLPAAVQPFIVAGPEILVDSAAPTAEIPSPVEATSGSMIERVGAGNKALGR